LLAPLTQRIGVAAVLDRIFGARLLVLVLAWCMGPSSPLFSGAVVLVNRVMSECVCRTFPLVTADIVDEDTVRNRRKDSLGASVIGTAALVSKLSQSVAPMLGYYLLSSIATVVKTGIAVATRADQLFVWSVLLYLPSACVVLQIAAWQYFPLRSAYMATVRSKLEAQESAEGMLASSVTPVSALAGQRTPRPDGAAQTGPGYSYSGSHDHSVV
jgi:Na+/melibiose symporter-like transporter